MIVKVLKDYLMKFSRPKDYVPEGALDIVRYFRYNPAIYFEYEKVDGVIIAKSTNFQYGSIVTSGKDEKEVDVNIKDAILTAFEIPSAYEKVVNVSRIDSTSKQYAAA